MLYWVSRSANEDRSTDKFVTCHTEKCTVEISSGRSGSMHAMYDIKLDDSGH